MFTASKSVACPPSHPSCTTYCARFYVVADYTKRSAQLGARFNYIPLEVLPIAFTPVNRHVEKCEGGTCVLRMAKVKAGPCITDNGNYIIDWHFDKQRQYDWRALDQRLHVSVIFIVT